MIVAKVCARSVPLRPYLIRLVVWEPHPSTYQLFTTGLENNLRPAGSRA